jgi:hypothetical protein
MYGEIFYGRHSAQITSTKSRKALSHCGTVQYTLHIEQPSYAHINADIILVYVWIFLKYIVFWLTPN